MYSKKNFDKTCTHTDFQRSWVGFYTTPELQLARRQGYTVLKIFEIWEFQNTINDNENAKCTGIFGDYFKTFIKLKIENTSWENNCIETVDDDKKKPSKMKLRIN